MSDDRVTTGEIFRICQRIEAQVNAQNGRVRRLENQVRVLWLGGVAMAGLGLAWIKHTLGL